MARWFAVLGPGILVAATGVGAGDLATGAIAGSRLGTSVLWAVLVGAGLKFVLNEGLARWQLVTGETLLEGCARHFGRVVLAGFLVYLLLWSVLVGSALMGACGVAAHAIFPLLDASQDKVLYGVAHSLLALVLVLVGGYRLFERVMGVCIALMFVVVVSTAIALRPDVGDVLRGMTLPRFSPGDPEERQWTLALLGGVGGTVTMLCYGYWIREEGRDSEAHVGACRLDLFCGYLMTALFGLAMVVIGGSVVVDGRGAGLVVDLSARLGEVLGTPWARLAFLAGAWGAFFSSLFGVWQSVPYLFADVVRLLGGTPTKPVSTTSPWYRGYLVGLATLPAVMLFFSSFVRTQKIYAIVGALFMPMLAAALLGLHVCGTGRAVRFRNRWWTNVVLWATLAFFVVAGILEVRARWLADA